MRPWRRLSRPRESEQALALTTGADCTWGRESGPQPVQLCTGHRCTIIICTILYYMYYIVRKLRKISPLPLRLVAGLSCSRTNLKPICLRRVPCVARTCADAGHARLWSEARKDVSEYRIYVNSMCIYVNSMCVIMLIVCPLSCPCHRHPFLSEILHGTPHTPSLQLRVGFSRPCCAHHGTPWRLLSHQGYDRPRLYRLPVQTTTYRT